jgi:hypothetical protein
MFVVQSGPDGGLAPEPTRIRYRQRMKNAMSSEQLLWRWPTTTRNR